MHSLLTAVLAAAALASTSADHHHHETHCHCRAMITTHDDLVDLGELPHTDVPTCDDQALCTKMCTDAWKEEMGGVGFDNQTPDGTTLGQQFCTEVFKQTGHNYFGPHTVFTYSSTCHGPWIHDGVYPTDHLCCKVGRHVPCPDEGFPHIH